jgi:hypothetical protein
VVGQQEKAINQLRIVAKINRKNFQAGFFNYIKKLRDCLVYVMVRYFWKLSLFWMKTYGFVTQPVCPIYFGAKPSSCQHVPK